MKQNSEERNEVFDPYASYDKESHDGKRTGKAQKECERRFG